jgi:RNA polymerase sigma factor (sigma-70 family)
LAIQKKTQAAEGPRVWTVAELGAFYTEHRSELLTHANRVVKDSAKAEEITQEALIKFILAAPELASEDHAVSYLHRTIENLCIDLFRIEGRRPNLVVLDDATSEVEAMWQVNGDHSEALSAAEDAAIIRQALALLSPAERAALVMWEMEGRSTEEIASELGTKESAVRHTVSRARASLRRILTELVIDEERGLTAMDLLSTTYKKASGVVKKSSKVALSLVLVLTAFLGFNSMTGNEGNTGLPSTTTVVSKPLPTKTSSGKTTSSAARQISAQDRQMLVSELATATQVLEATAQTAQYLRVSSTAQGWIGLDVSGIPVGFTTNTGAGQLPTQSGWTKLEGAHSVFVSSQADFTAYLTQNIQVVDGQPVVDISAVFSPQDGTFLQPAVTSQSLVVTPGYNGGKLLNIWISLAGSGSASALPDHVNVRIYLSETGSVTSESAQFGFSSTKQASS